MDILLIMFLFDIQVGIVQVGIQVDLLVRAIIKFLLTISLLKLLFSDYIIIKYFLRTVQEKWHPSYQFQ